MTALHRSPEAPRASHLPSPGFRQWLHDADVSLVLSTYKQGALVLVGRHEGELTVLHRQFGRSAGMVLHQGALWVASDHSVTRHDDVVGPSETFQGFDRLFVQRTSWFLGGLELHDLAVADDPRPLVAVTTMNCVGRLSEDHSFVPVWRPRFIDAMVLEDRCHLNGLATRDGQLFAATVCAPSNARHGWRTRRVGSGQLLHTPTHEVLVDGLTMPHSPRWREGAIYLLDSGRGRLLRVEPERRRVEVVAQLDGFARGLALTGPWALVGRSVPHGHDGDLATLPIVEEARHRASPPLAGVDVVDLRTGRVEHRLDFPFPIEEIYDVLVLPGVRRPNLLPASNGLARRIIRLPR